MKHIYTNQYHVSKRRKMTRRTVQVSATRFRLHTHRVRFRMCRCICTYKNTHTHTNTRLRIHDIFTHMDIMRIL